jgi:chromosome transmission fidelity protein 1
MEEGNDYSFPYKPYPQQIGLMDVLYNCLESSSVGIFESPTGTGKSLSAISASLTWLERKESEIIDGKGKIPEDSTAKESDWLSAFIASTDGKKSPSDDLVSAKLKYDEVLRTIASKNSSKHNSAKFSGKRSQSNISSGVASLNKEAVPLDGSGDSVYLIGSYESDGEATDDFNSEDADLSEFESSVKLWNALKLPQIIYCSRTHSQLAQFVSEIKKTKFQNIRCLILGSRKSYCINSSVKALKSEQFINDKCMELQSSTKSSKSVGSSQKKLKVDGFTDKIQPKASETTNGSSKCPYRNLRKEVDFSLSIFASIKDIEDVVNESVDLEVCPYYSLKKATPYAQILCMPYSVLLHKSIREQNNVVLSKDRTVVIIDEAHNLIEAINSIHSAETTLKELSAVSESISGYMKRFQTLLNAKNHYYINLLLLVVKRLCSAILSYIHSQENSGTTMGQVDELKTINTFLFESSIDHINFFKLCKYIDSSNLVNRIGGYCDAVKARSAEENDQENTTNQVTIHTHNRTPRQESKGLKIESGFISFKTILRRSINFILALTNADGDGRIQFIIPSDINSKSEATIRYVMLNPKTHFQAIVDQVKSLVLLGGTMRPMSYFENSLFPAISRDRLHEFSCGHIIPSNHVKGVVISRASLQRDSLEFTFQKRLSQDSTDDLHLILRELLQVVPHGVVVFFASYGFLGQVVARWKSEGKLKSLEQAKRLFVETKNSESNEKVWEGYCDEILKHSNRSSYRGAVLFSVLNGKLSEGINFSDNLARAVVVVGMPYPDFRDPILREKVRYFQSLSAHSSKDQDRTDQRVDDSKNFDLLETMCMKAVNQAIGRSIRHRNDYASIVLIDHRYTRKQIREQLPEWIAQSITVTNQSTESHSPNALETGLHEIREFFLAKSVA